MARSATAPRHVQVAKGDGARTSTARSATHNLVSVGSSLDRLLGLLDIFTPERPIWAADEILQMVPISRATLYRHLQRLCTVGLLAPTGRGQYSLGPRVIELDRQIRAGDPLLIHAPAVMEAVAKESSGVVLLCSHYGERVLCIHQEAADPRIHSSMERGRPFPLFRSAASKAILAHLPAHRLRRLMLYHGPEIQHAELGATWPEFRQRLKQIRNDGVYVSRGEIDPELIGIAAPIFHAPEQIAASVTIVVPKRGLEEKTLLKLKMLAKNAAAEISRRLMSDR